MKKEEKELLFKDLCGRLPYRVKVKTEDGKYPLPFTPFHLDFYKHNIEDIKPYLFPLSSMTEEQKEIYCKLQDKVIYNSKGPTTEDILVLTNWLDENMFDWIGLIPIGLAIDATGLNIYN